MSWNIKEGRYSFFIYVFSNNEFCAQDTQGDSGGIRSNILGTFIKLMSINPYPANVENMVSS